MSMKRGGVLGILAYALWGVLPFYWKALAQLPPAEVLAHRLLWAFVLVGLFFAFTGDRREIKKLLADRQARWRLPVLSLLIGLNMLTFIYAITSDRILEASIGYFLSPLITVLLSVLLLGERLTRTQWLALLLASVGVVFQALAAGEPPWIAVILSFSFGFYGAIKKPIRVGPLLGMGVEFGLWCPLVLCFLVFSPVENSQAILHGTWSVQLLLVGAGLVTVAPLLLYAAAIQQVRLSTMGFLHYLAPTLQFLIGLVIFHEPFGLLRLAGFGFIWVGLALYLIHTGRTLRRGLAPDRP